MTIEPPAPLHTSEYVWFEVRLDINCEPAVDCAPLQPPEAIHLDVLVLDQLTVAEVPEAIEDGVTESVSVGVGALGAATEKDVSVGAEVLPVVSWHAT